MPPFLSTPLSFNNTVTADGYLQTMPTLGLAEQSFQTTNYAPNDYRAHDGMTMTLPNPERNFTPNYDDFNYENVAQEAPEAQEPQILETASIDRDDELLGFSAPTYNYTLLDYSLRRTSVSLAARLHGMFFMANTASTPNLFPQITPPELTCYRRNLFQVTGSITLPRNLRYIMMDNGERVTIVAQELTVSATESVEGHAVKLISVPWKTPAGNGPTQPEDKTEKEPVSIPLDTMSNQDMDAEYATFPIAWKRLQFRIATANNGRRKELQQHFTARLKLVATLSTGVKVPIAEVKSAAIVVRGRSPRNFRAKNDISVGGDKSTSRKGIPHTPTVFRRSTSDSAASKSSSKNTQNQENPFGAFNFTMNDSSIPNPFSGSSSAPAHPTPTFKTPTLPSTRTTSSASPPSAPQLLSTSDEPDPKRPRQRPPKVPRKNSHNTRPHPYKPSSLPTLPSTKALLSSHSSRPDPADRHYEYFPLSADNWQPPVDGIYRPHIDHHIPMATGAADARGLGVAPRNKRYFSEDVAG